MEWSGVLFYTHTGTFEDNNLEIHCEDFFPMDLGEATFTQFKNDESVVSYIAENMELFDCELGLCHSHNQMSCFFSGTDTSTLRSEGNDTNCFVSLIVNNAGSYCAAITRKIKQKTEVITKSEGLKYEFFGEGNVQVDTPATSTQIFDEEVIQYFMLDVEREVIDNPYDFLDKRFDEIETQKKAQAKPAFASTRTASAIERDADFYDWMHSSRKESVETKMVLPAREQTLFTEQEMAEMTDVSKWEPDPTIIHHLVCQMVACSLIIDTERFDLEQWIVKHMNKKYLEIFGTEGTESPQFHEYKEFIVEFMINQYNGADTPPEVYDDWDGYLCKIASAMHDELYVYSSTAYPYIDAYLEVLTRYIYA